MYRMIICKQYGKFSDRVDNSPLGMTAVTMSYGFLPITCESSYKTLQIVYICAFSLVGEVETQCGRRKTKEEDSVWAKENFVGLT